jgi:hypothetical protein
VLSTCKLSTVSTNRRVLATATAARAAACSAATVARVGAVEAGADVIEGGPYRARVAVAAQMLGEQALGLEQLGCRQ